MVILGLVQRNIQGALNVFQFLFCEGVSVTEFLFLGAIGFYQTIL